MSVSDPATAFRGAMRHLAAGVAVVAASCDGERNGLTATAICSVSMAPPQLLVCVNAGAVSHDAILRARHFSVNLLAEEQRDIAEIFAGRSGCDRGARFESSGVWRAGPHAMPLLEGAVARIACRVVNMVATGTHTVFIGEVIEAESQRGRRPLLFAEGRYHGLGTALSGAA